LIPVADFFGKPILHRRLVLAMSANLLAPNFGEMLRNNQGHRVALRLFFQIAVDPGAFRPVEDRLHIPVSPQAK